MSPLSYPEPLVSVREDWKKDARLFLWQEKDFRIFCFVLFWGRRGQLGLGSVNISG